MKYRVNNSKLALIISIIIMVIGIFKNEILLKNQNEIKNNDNYLSYNIDTTDEISLISEFINENRGLFEFYADTFAIKIEDLEEQLILSNDTNSFNKYDIANSGSIYDSLDINIIDYLYELEDSNPKLFNKKNNKNDKSKDYIYNLLNYYCNLYNVDYQILASIAYIESGNLNAKGMLNKNNIYGGMSNSNKLISYRNISYGVLSYVRLMKNKYFDKGLDTVESIGYVFNPVMINGKKTVNSKWLNNVNSVLSKFDNTTIINSINDLDNII